MLETVSASNIEKLTEKSAFSSSSLEKMPTVQEMVERICSELSFHGENPEKFKELIKKVPPGFCLTQVLYTNVGEAQKTVVMTEFVTNVRRLFLKHLAIKHKDELNEIGIHKNGIKRMKKGLDPEDKNGIPYHINIDHKIERGGGGWLSEKKKSDPMMQAGNASTFMVNHINNLLLLPKETHDLKNEINAKQKLSKLNIRESKWALIMIPEKCDGRSGLVAPATGTHLAMHTKKTAGTIGSTRNIAIQTYEAVQHFLKEPPVDQSIGRAVKKAGRRNRTVVELMMEEKKKPSSAKGDISSFFDRTMYYNRDQRKLMETSVIPLLKETNNRVRTAFEAVKSGASKEEINRFNQIFHGEGVSGLHGEIVKLPIPEAVCLHRTLNKIGKTTFVNASSLNNNKIFEPKT